MKTATKKKTETESKPKKPRAKKAQVVISLDERESQYRALRLMVNNYYDFDRHRLALEQRCKPQSKNGTVIQLHPDDVLSLQAQAEQVALFQKGALTGIKQLLRKMPFYCGWLKDFEGVGEVGAAIIMSQFDIQIADTPSKFWSFAGLCPVPARRCKTCHNIVEEKAAGYQHVAYAKFRKAGQAQEDAAKACPVADGMPQSATYESGKAMKPVKGEKLPYNAWLRSKLVGAVGSAQITNTTKWREVYDGYKHRKLSQGWGVSDGHRHNAAIRFMVKMMLLEIWTAWREFEGLPVRPSYHEEKLGHVHSK
jgi:hypothetical protein